MKPVFQRTSLRHLTACIASAALAMSLVATASAANDDDDDLDATSFPHVERKVKRLKKRVKALETEVAALQALHNPVEELVDCAAGNTIAAALANHADGGKLTIRISGICAEAVVVSRSNVVIDGAGTATVQAPAGAIFTISAVSNVNNVTVSNLTVIGGATAGIAANKGAQIVARGVVVHSAGAGAMALDNGVLDVTGSTLRNNAQGAYAARGGVVSVDSSTIENNATGVLAFKAGVIILTSSNPDYAQAGTGPIVQNNTTGAVVRSGGFLEVADTVIQNNANYGIVVDTGGSMQLFAQLRTGGGNRITGNPVGGLLLNRHASLVVSDLTNVITGNGRGIFCVNNPGYLVPVGFTVAGNPQGDIVGCVP